MTLRTLIRTRDVGAVTFAASVLGSDDIYYLVADANYAAGGVGVLPIRLMVSDSDFDRAKELLVSAGVESDKFDTGEGQKS